MTLTEHPHQSHHTNHHHHHHHHWPPAPNSAASTSPPSSTVLESMESSTSNVSGGCSSPSQTSLTSSNSSTFAIETTNQSVTPPINPFTDSGCSSTEQSIVVMSFLERKPYRPFRSNEEYLIAMKEDLADWLNTLYGLDLTCDNFLQRLETGVILCQHANSVLRKVGEWRLTNSSNTSNGIVGHIANSSSLSSSIDRRNSTSSNNHSVIGPTATATTTSSSASAAAASSNPNISCTVTSGSGGGVVVGGPSETMMMIQMVPVKLNAMPGTFQARDNVANFIEWCRRIQIHECLLFETEDLVGRKNEKSFVLCLLEVARYGAKFGVLAPTLVQFEQEIDKEIEKDQQRENKKKKMMKMMMINKNKRHLNGKLDTCDTDDFDDDVDDCTDAVDDEDGYYEEEDEEEEEDDGPLIQITNNDLESLHEKVVNLLSRCTCPVQFYLEHLSEGKYRIGDTRTLIFVRILRNHVMVRVGGGWDTLEHYLEKHDPCRCRFGRFNNSNSISGSRILANNSTNNHHHQQQQQQHHQQNQHPQQQKSTIVPLHMQVIVDRPDTQQPQSISCLKVNSSPVLPRRANKIDQSINHSSSTSSVRRASTSSNDSQGTASSCSVTESAIMNNQNGTSSLERNCHSMTNFVFPDRNNNIKGLQANQKNQNRVLGPAATYAKRRLMNGSDQNSTPCSSSRIPKSRVNSAAPISRIAMSSRSSMFNSSLSSLNKQKSTSICSLAHSGHVPATTGQTSNTESRIPSLDHRRLLNNYGYSSHNIYLACANTPTIDRSKPPPTNTNSCGPRQLRNRSVDHRTKGSNTNRLNKSTIDLVSSQRNEMTNSSRSNSNSFYSMQPVPTNRNSMGPRSIAAPNSRNEMYLKKGHQAKSTPISNLPRTRSTQAIPSSTTNLIKKQTAPTSIVNVTTPNKRKKRLQGSVTSLNSAGSTEGGTSTTASSNGSLNEAAVETTRPVGQLDLKSKTSITGDKKSNLENETSINGVTKQRPVQSMVGTNEQDLSGNKALVEICSWLERNKGL